MPTSAMPDEHAEQAGQREQHHLGLEQRPAGARDRERIAAGAAQDRAVGGAHQPEPADQRDEQRPRGSETGSSGGLTPMIVCSQTGALPPGLGRSRIARPCQTKLMPSVTTIEGRLRRWMSAPSAGIDGDAAEQHERRRASGVVMQPGRGDAADEADKGADRQIEVVARDDEHLRHGRERDRDRQVQHQREAEIADGARVEPGDRRDARAPATAPAAPRAAARRTAPGARAVARTASAKLMSCDLGEGGMDDAALRSARRARDRRRSRRCGTHRRGRNSSARRVSVVYQRKVRPRCASRADQVIDFELGADSRRRASGRPSGRCGRRSRARGRTAPSADCRRTATGCCCRHRACGSASVSRQELASAVSRARRDQQARRASRSATARRCSRAIDHCGKTPSDCRSPATSATGAVDLGAGPAARRGVERRDQQIGLAVAGEPGKADDLALVRDAARAPSVCRSRPGAHAQRRARAPRRAGVRASALAPRRRPWRRPASRGRNSARGRPRRPCRRA